MNTETPFYVFSAERFGLSAHENASRTEFLRAFIRKARLPHIEVEGRYNGHTERSFLVLGKDAHEPVLRLARMYDQESVLFVDANREAALYSVQGELLAMLGHWHEVSPECAATLEAVTRSPDGRYWSATA